jgi:hypothetical protein
MLAKLSFQFVLSGKRPSDMMNQLWELGKAYWYVGRWLLCQFILAAAFFVMPSWGKEGKRFARALAPYLKEDADFSDVLPPAAQQE